MATATMQDWKNELIGKSSIDKSGFETFIPRNGDDIFLQEAFSGLKGGQELIIRIKSLLCENNNEGWYVVPRYENRLPEEKLKELLFLYQQNISVFLGGVGQDDLAIAALQPNIQVVYSNDDFYHILKSRTLKSSGIEDVLSDAFRDYMAKVGDFTYALKEAVLFLTKYPAITRYLMEPVLEFPLQHRPYYDLWKAGGDCHFFADRILMLCENGPS